MNSKKLQMLTAVAASILLGIGLATVPASAKTHKGSSAYSAQAEASSKEKKPSKKTAKKEPSKQSAKNTTKAKTVGQGGGHEGHQEYDGP